MTPPHLTAEAHLRRMADVLDEARQELAGGGVPPTCLLFGLRRLVGADCASFSETDIPTRRSLSQQDTDPGEESTEGYWRWRHQHLLCLQVSRPHSSPEATQLTDFMSVRQLTGLAIYTEFIAPIKSIATITLPTAPNRTRVFQFFREDGNAFSEHEMTTLRMMAPHVYDLYKEAARRRRPPVPLTHRELDVLRCVALGMSTPQIAEQLVVSPSTVRKHLENAFGRLGVSSRTAAVARVFPEPEAL